jgi:hypothetical protein
MIREPFTIAVGIFVAVTWLFGAFLLTLGAPCHPPSLTCFGPPAPEETP